MAVRKKKGVAAPVLQELSPADLRREMLRNSLPEILDMLRRRQAASIPSGYIDDYIDLNWLEWHGGNLRATTVGENICRQLHLRRVQT